MQRWHVIGVPSNGIIRRHSPAQIYPPHCFGRQRLHQGLIVDPQSGLASPDLNMVCVHAASSRAHLIDVIRQTSIDEAHISIRFKHGIHTIYLFVDALAPFSSASHELLELLRERYPSGLTTSVAPPKRTLIEADSRLAYGVLNNPTDPSKGWKRLQTGKNDENTPTKCGLKNNSILSFAVLKGDQPGEGDEDDEVVFEVEWPREEELYETGP